MAVTKPVKVPPKNITTTDIISFDGGLDQRGAENGKPNTFIEGRNAMVNSRGLLTHRYGLKSWLPDTVGTVYEVFPALYDGVIYYLVADDGKVKWTRAGDLNWVDCGGDNEVTTTDCINTFFRVQDKVVVVNGKDKLRYIDLSNREMVQFAAVTNPANAPTVTPTGLTNTGNFKIYYAISFNSTVGDTALSPILTYTVNKSRDTWKTDGTEYLTVERNNTTPANAVSWNLHMALAPQGATIAVTDMLMLAAGLDISQTKFTDTGTIPIDLDRGTASEDNSTDGAIATYGRETDGRAILYGIVGDEYALLIGGYGEDALDFSPNNGGYRKVLNKGTNYYPMSVVGFRNGQGIPSLTVLFSNTQGLSKQSILEQQTVTYGNYSFVVWATTEQNYGAAGVSSPYAVLNYQGGLYLPSTDGIIKMDTEASLQNVLATIKISGEVEETVGTIRNASLDKIVGTAWSSRIYFSIPSRGYSYNNEILVYDVSKKEKPIWYSLDIRAQWIGTISPNDQAAFVYICQDNHIFRFQKAYVALDDKSDGTTAAFPVAARGTLMGINEAHNSFKAVVQVVFYLIAVIGTVEVGVTYRNENGKLKTKSKLVTQSEYAKSSVGGWSSPGYLFNQNTGTEVLTWGDIDNINDTQSSQKETIRVRVPLNVIGNEFQWFINTNLDNSSFILRSVSYEGENLGVKVDLR